jgi:hypothetical protein
MSFTRLASVSRDGSGTTSNIDTTGANLIVGSVADAFDDDLTVSDSLTNIWTKLTLRAGASTDRVRLYYTLPTSVGSGHNFSINDVFFNFPSLCIIAYSGAMVSPYDQQSGTSAGGTQPGSITPPGNGTLFIAARNGSSGATIDSGFSIVESVTGTRPSQLAELIQVTAAAINPTWSGGNVPLAMATFKALASGRVVLGGIF